MTTPKNAARYFARTRIWSRWIYCGGDETNTFETCAIRPYYIVLSRAHERPEVQVWPLQFRDRLPVLPIPLGAKDKDVPLDLAAALAAVYERGGYGDLIDYEQRRPSHLATTYTEQRRRRMAR